MLRNDVRLSFNGCQGVPVHKVNILDLETGFIEGYIYTFNVSAEFLDKSFEKPQNIFHERL